MRRSLVVVVALSVAWTVPRARPSAAAESCPPETCLDVTVPVDGDRVADRRVRVLVPEGYWGTERRYPVLYLLHGADDDYRAWTERTDLAAFAASRPLIVVMPDGGRGAQAGWYSDWRDGSRSYETFHLRSVMRYVDARFRTLGAGHRAVAGNSMGGFGAMSYAARHPGLFAAAASFSGALDVRYLPPLSGIAFTALHDFGTPDQRVWGNQIADVRTWESHNPRDLASRLSCTELFLSAGSGGPGGPAGEDPFDPAGYAVEHFILQMNRSFIGALQLAGVGYQADLYQGGYHGFPYWQRELHRELPEIVEATSRPRPIPCITPSSPAGRI